MSRYEDDPAWIAARSEAERRRMDGETPSDHLFRGIQALQRMYEIETQYDRTP